MGGEHKLTLTAGVVSVALVTPSAWLVAGVVGMVCVTAIAVTAITSSSKEGKN